MDKNIFNESPKKEKENEVPQPIKSKIALSLTTTLVINIFILLSGLVFPEFNNIPIFIAFLIFSIYILLACLGTYIGIKIYGYVTFSGYIVNYKKNAFSKNSYTIQFYDEDKNAYISFKYTGKNSLEYDLPLTLYVYPNEPIKMTEDGYFFEKYITCVFSSKYDDSSKELTAKDFSSKT